MALTKTSYFLLNGASVNVLDYGAYNDNTNAATTTAAIQAAINTGKNVYFPQGQYAINAALNVYSSGQRLYGDSRGNTQILQNTVGANGIVVDNKQDVQIENLYLVANGTNTQVGLLVKNGCINSVFKDLKVTNFNTGIVCDDTNQVYFQNIFSVDCLLSGFAIQSSGGTSVDTTIDNLYSAGHGTGGNGNCLTIVGNCSGVYVYKSQLQLSENTGLYIASNGDGEPSACFFDQVIIDTNAVNGLNLTRGNNMRFVDCWFSNRTSAENCLLDTNSTDITFVGCKVYYTNGHGIKNKGNKNAFIGCSIEDVGIDLPNTYDGIRLENASATQIVGTRIWSTRNTTRYGISSTGSTNSTYIVGCNLDGNVSGGYLDGGSVANNRYLNQYQGGSASIANGATATLYTFPSEVQGTYLFFAGQASNTNGGIRAMAYVRVGSGSLALTSLAAVQATLSASGLDVQVTNSAGGAVTFEYSWIKL